MNSAVRALTFCIAASMVAGCGGGQLGLGPPIAGSQTSAARPQIVTAKSWMLTEAKSEKLIYTTDSRQGAVIAVSYRTGKVVGTLYGLDAPFGECSDAHGNVFVTDHSDIVEYAHAGTTVIGKVSYSGVDFINCSIDPTTGDLAATMFQLGAVAIFPHAHGNAKVVQTVRGQTWACTYDPKGNLFVDEGDQNFGTSLEELPKNENSFVLAATGLNVNFGPLQWHNGDLLLDVADIQQFRTTDMHAKFVGHVQLAGGKSFRDLGESQFVAQDGEVVVPFGVNPHSPLAFKLGIWKYPSGKFVKAYSGFGNVCLFGVAISVP